MTNKPGGPQASATANSAARASTGHIAQRKHPRHDHSPDNPTHSLRQSRASGGAKPPSMRPSRFTVSTRLSSTRSRVLLGCKSGMWCLFLVFPGQALAYCLRLCATGAVHYLGSAGFRLARVMRSRLAARAASSSSVRSSSSWRRSSTCCSSWPTRVRSVSASSVRPMPLAWKTSSPSTSDSRAVRSVFCVRSRWFCSRRLARSASRDCLLAVVEAGLCAGGGGAGVDLGAQVVVAVEEGPVDAGGPGDGGDADLLTGRGQLVQGAEYALPAAGAVAAAGSDEGFRAGVRSCGAFFEQAGRGRADAGHAEVDGPAGGADHLDGLGDLAPVGLRRAGRGRPSARRMSCRSLVISSSEGMASALAQSSRSWADRIRSRVCSRRVEVVAEFG